jgi:hypothetical protein
MRLRLCLAPLLAALCGSALAHDYPTVDRVEYVLECLRNNGGEYEYIYKCSCVIDEIARTMSYDDYVESATISRYQGMGGERAGVFRDPEPLKEKGKAYRALQADAARRCGIAKK